MLSGFILAGVLFMTAGDSMTVGPVEVVGEGFVFTEGPLWHPKDGLVFSDTRADTIYRADRTVWRKPSGGANGLALDPEGNVVMCEAGNHRITRVDASGKATVLVDSFEGKDLSTTNDLVVRSDGTIFFTDPRPLVGRARAAIQADCVYALSPDGTLRRLLDHLKYPNGIALSPDESTLYVVDMNGGAIFAYALAKDGSVSEERELCKVRGPDGMTVASDGSLWCANTSGISVFDASGRLLETIKLPQMPSNCAFGGDDMKTLYVTARKAVYKVRCKVSGIRR